MLASAATHLLQVFLAAVPEGRWLGQDYGLALLAASFPAWTLITLLRGWFRPRPVAATAPSDC